MLSLLLPQAVLLLSYAAFSDRASFLAVTFKHKADKLILVPRIFKTNNIIYKICRKGGFMNLIFHIDVNSAYLSWSAIERLKKEPQLDLRTVPSIIGGDEKSRHGVVLAKSIPAKKYGVRTGEPVASALRKCPFLIMEPPSHKLYSKRSRELMELLNSYTSDIEQVSIDECYLFYTPISHRFSSAAACAREIADRIRRELGFTVNIGIAPNRLLAKMASDFEKPDKIHTLMPDEIPQKMWPLPVRELYMVGHSSADRLTELGIRTIGELAHADPAFLRQHFKSHGTMMWEYANGIDPAPLTPDHHEAKGIGNSVTLGSDVCSAGEARQILLSLSEQVASRLRKSHLLAWTVTVEIKYSTFRSCSRQTQLSAPDSTSGVLYEYSCHLFDELWNGTPIRLLGLRTSKLVPETAPVQLSLFEMGLTQEAPAQTHTVTPPAAVNTEKQKKLQSAVDEIRKKFGENAVIRGTLLLEHGDNLS